MQSKLHKKILKLFKNDSRTLNRLKKNSDFNDAAFLELALKCRPKNKELIKLNSAFNSKKTDNKTHGGMVYKHIPSGGISQEECDIQNNHIEEEPEEVVEIEDKEIRSSHIENNEIKYIKNSSTHITLLINGNLKIITPEKFDFEKIDKALVQEDWKTVLKLMDTKGLIKEIVNDKFQIIGNSLFREGKLIEGVLADKIVVGIKSGVTDVEPFIKFLDKVNQNEDPIAVRGLYDFLKGGNIPITQKGNIVTYKKIKMDWKDCWTGNIDNSVGQLVTMDRKLVDKNNMNTCSSGLHVASWDYMKSFSGSRIVLCEVNPKDVVSVPPDYANTKMRCCRYKVIKEVALSSGEIMKDKIIF